MTQSIRAEDESQPLGRCFRLDDIVASMADKVPVEFTLCSRTDDPNELTEASSASAAAAASRSRGFSAAYRFDSDGNDDDSVFGDGGASGDFMPITELFDEAQRRIVDLMRISVLPRFLEAAAGPSIIT